MMKILYKLFLIILLMVSVMFSVEIRSGEVNNIEVDLSRPLYVEWPCEINFVGAGGERGLRIPAKVGRGWRDEAGGLARYKFYIPKDGKYVLWGYCKWFDVCANAVFYKVDGMDKAILGNDPLYKQWHWVRGVEMELAKGTHSIELSNHSDHIAIQKLMFINSMSKTPTDSGNVFRDIFYEGFDGCDRGNFDQWKQFSGKWEIVDPLGEGCLVNTSLKVSDSGMIIYDKQKFWNCVINLEIKTNNNSVVVCFGVFNEKEYYGIKFNRNSKAEIIRCENGNISVIKEFEQQWRTEEFNDVMVILSGEKCDVRINDEQEITFDVENHPGGIGFVVGVNSEVYFDNIHISNIEKENKNDRN